MHNATRRLWVTMACCLGSAGVSPSAAQTAAAAGQTDVPVLQYENGRVLQAYLPYSRPFVISGSPLTAKGRADVVWGRIFEQGGPMEPVTASCWLRPAGAAEDTKFRTLFDPLTLGREYTVRLNFAQSIAPDVVRRGVLAGLREAVDEAEEAQNAKAARGTDDKVEVAEDAASRHVAAGIRREVETRLGTKPLYVQVTREGECGTTNVLDVRLTPGDLERMGRAVGARLDLRRAMDRWKAPSDALQRMDGRKVQELLAALRAARADRASRGLAYTPADVEALSAAFQTVSAAGLDPAAAERLGSLLVKPAATPRRLVQHTGTLHALLATLGQLRVAEAAVPPVQARVDATGLGVDSIAPQVQGQFIPVSEASMVETSWGAEAEVRKLQIGTAVSGSSVVFGPDGSDRDAVMVAALRFYLAPVDRSLPVPWSSTRARAALDVGALFQSDLTYRGQQQNKLFNGITPTLGVSYDLTRYLSVTGGWLFFRQPSTNPLAAASASRVRTAMYLGVGTDFDALNQLNGLLTRK